MSRRTTILIALALVWIVVAASILVVRWRVGAGEWPAMINVVVVGLMLIQMLILAFLGSRKQQ